MGVADAAQNLHGVVYYLPERLGRELLDLRDQSSLIACCTDAIVDGLGHGVGQGAGRIQLGDAVGYLEVHSLEAPDCHAEGLAFVGIACRQLQDRPGAPNSSREQPFRHHQLVEYLCPFILLAQQVLRRHRHIAKDQSARARAPTAHQSVDMLYLYAHIPLNYEGAQRVAAGSGVGDGKHEEEVGAFGAHHKPLLSGKIVVVAPLAGHRRGSEEIGPASRLGQCLAGPLCARDQRLEVLLLLSFGSKHV